MTLAANGTAASTNQITAIILDNERRQSVHRAAVKTKDGWVGDLMDHVACMREEHLRTITCKHTNEEDMTFIILHRHCIGSIWEGLQNSV
jgi:hypothetical protein